MNNKHLIVIQLVLGILCTVAIEYFFFNDFLMLFAFLNPLALFAVISFILPQKTQTQLQKKDTQREMQTLAKSINHNINTPLTKIMAQCERAIKSGENTKGTFKKILMHAESLKSVNANYIKLFNVMHTTSNYCKPVDIVELIKVTIIQLVDEIEKKQIFYAVNLPDVPILIEGDKALLEEALLNLLRYIVDHTAKDEMISINLTCTQTDCSIIMLNTHKKKQYDFSNTTYGLFNTHSHYEKYNLENESIALKLSKVIIEKHHGLIEYNGMFKDREVYHINIPKRSYSLT